MLSIHWLYRRSRNSVVKSLAVDVIAMSHTTSSFIMADVNVWERDSLLTTPTLKSNAGDQNVCKIKNLSWLFGVNRKLRPSGSLFGITRQSLVMPNSDPRTDFFYPHLKLMTDSYNLVSGSLLSVTPTSRHRLVSVSLAVLLLHM